MSDKIRYEKWDITLVSMDGEDSPGASSRANNPLPMCAYYSTLHLPQSQLWLILNPDHLPWSI